MSCIIILTTETLTQGKPRAWPRFPTGEGQGAVGGGGCSGTLPRHLTQTLALSTNTCTESRSLHLTMKPNTFINAHETQKLQPCQMSGTWVIWGELVHSYDTVAAAGPGVVQLHTCPSVLRLTRYSPEWMQLTEAQCLPLILGLCYPHTVKNARNTSANFALAHFSTPRWRPSFRQGLKRTAGTGSNSQWAVRFTNIIIPNAHCLSVSLLTPTSEHSVARSFTSHQL